MSAKYLGLVGLSAILSTCMPSPQEHTGNHLQVLSPKTMETDQPKFRLLVKKCDYPINGWNAELDHVKILEYRPGTFPFDTIINLTYEGIHQLVITNWDYGGNILRDTIVIDNSK